jgi:predicted polyphosphate/ATP-dependent NAD kinase
LTTLSETDHNSDLLQKQFIPLLELLGKDKPMLLGFIVNPIAGMGGKVGLKGTDNAYKEALAKGATPIAPSRATEFLRKLKRNLTNEQIAVLTCPGIMGEEEAIGADFPVKVLPMRIEETTTANDTKTAVDLLNSAGVDLIVFVGGDGTAKDIFDAARNSPQTPVLGVPSGVKMYSGVFAISPMDAVEVVLAYAQGHASTTELEIMDSDEKAIQKDVFAVKLLGFLKSPFLANRIQGSKEASPETEDEIDNQKAIAKFIIEELPSGATLILGPGTTVKQIADTLGIRKTVLGVDVYLNGRETLDVDEKQILSLIDNWENTWIILSPIGHQGILLGRGNQQISPNVIKRVGKARVVIAATKSKLQTIDEKTLRVDTGDAEADAMLGGYIRVVTDYKEWRMVQVR